MAQKEVTDMNKLYLPWLANKIVLRSTELAARMGVRNDRTAVTTVYRRRSLADALRGL
jgi:hypothetical protein